MLHPAIAIRSNRAIHVNGLITTQLIQKQTLLWRLHESTFSWKEIEAWPNERLRAFHRYGFQCGVDRYSLPEDLSREGNHSCLPNTFWKDGHPLVARRVIPASEEFTYAYSTRDFDLVFRMEWHCGTPCCRGTLTNRDHLDPAWQQQYGLNL